MEGEINLQQWDCGWPPYVDKVTSDWEEETTDKESMFTTVETMMHETSDAPSGHSYGDPLATFPSISLLLSTFKYSS